MSTSAPPAQRVTLSKRSSDGAAGAETKRARKRLPSPPPPTPSTPRDDVELSSPTLTPAPTPAAAAPKRKRADRSGKAKAQAERRKKVLEDFDRVFLSHVAAGVAKGADCAALLEEFKDLVSDLDDATFKAVLAHTKRALQHPAARPRQVLDDDATMQAYHDRLNALPTELFKALDGKWLSNFMDKTAVPAAELLAPGYVTNKKSIATVTLFHLARAKGVEPLGIVCESGKKAPDGGRVHNVVVDGPRVYVGQQQVLWKMDASPFALSPSEDYHYVKNQEAEGAADDEGDA